MKRKTKNAFTLIELLAVIVILAIIALIATPIILGIVEDARKDAFLRSVELVVSTTDIDIASKPYEDTYTYTITDGIISNLEVGVKNTEGMNGSITYDKQGNDEYAINNGVYCVIKSSGEKAQIKDYVEGERTVNLFFANGQRVYFDVVKGTGCTMEEYASSGHPQLGDFLNSAFEYNGVKVPEIFESFENIEGFEGISSYLNSCLLFYAFNDDGGKTINLILDHNTLEVTPWTDANTESNTNGPINALSELRNATDSWQGTIIPENYTVHQEAEGTIYGNYTIPYKTEEYKARLITAQEIAQITGADKKEGLMFDESTSSNRFAFETLNQVDGDYCTSDCEYGWLYDRTISCKDYGCLNNAIQLGSYGYWTGTSILGFEEYAWEVSYGYLAYDGHTLPSSYGVRPVIEVLKSKVTYGEAPVIPE